MTKEEIFIVIDYYYQKKQKPLLIHIHANDEEIEKVKEYLQERNYVEWEKYYDLKQHTEGDLEPNSWVTLTDKKEIENTLLILRSLEEQLDILQDELPLFEYDCYDTQYDIYNSGFKARISLKKVNVLYSLIIRDEENEIIKKWTLQTKEEIQETISEWIRNNYQQQRVRSIINPSKERFQRFLGSELLRDEEEKMYQAFLKHFSPLEIEIIGALYFKHQLDYKEIKEGYDVFEYEGKNVLLSRKSKKIYVFEKNGNEQQNMIEIIQQEIEDELKEIFKKIL